MGKLFLDSELEKNVTRPLEEAFGEAFEADMPLVLELLFVSGEEIRSLNAEKRGVDRVTDVLSFPACELVPGEPILSDEHGECVETVITEDETEEERMYLGSVVICTERAREQAEEYGHSEAREICYLAAHGLLHCLGYDHEEEAEKQVMRKKEEEIMKKLGLGRGE